jgi:hypothetical protein
MRGPCFVSGVAEPVVTGGTDACGAALADVVALALSVVEPPELGVLLHASRSPAARGSTVTQVRLIFI